MKKIICVIYLSSAPPELIIKKVTPEMNVFLYKRNLTYEEFQTLAIEVSATKDFLSIYDQDVRRMRRIQYSNAQFNLTESLLGLQKYSIDSFILEYNGRSTRYERSRTIGNEEPFQGYYRRQTL